jgi:transcription elongation factor GreA
MQRRLITYEGYERLMKELEDLRKQRRPLSQAIGRAREMGDLSENAEYHAARERLGLLEGKIADLEFRLSQVQLVDPSQIDKSKAYFSAKVTLLEEGTQKKVHYQLVGMDEAEPNDGKLSISSPVGKAILGHGLNEKIEVKTPAGVSRYQIVKIEW